MTALSTSVEALKILVYSAPLGFSHMQFMGEIADRLQEAGHDVTVLHPLSQLDHAHAVSKMAKQHVLELPLTMRQRFDRRELGLWQMGSNSIRDRLAMIMSFSNLQKDSCEYLLQDNYTMTTLQNARFDVGITEVFAVCGFGLFEMVDIPHVIGASAVGMFDSMNEFVQVPTMPSFVPCDISLVLQEMTFPQRFVNFFLHNIVWLATQHILHSYERLFSRYGLDTNLQQLINNRVNYVLSNSDEFLDIALPSTGKLVHVGGIALPEAATLPEDFRTVMGRNGSKGVVLISFGSNAPTVQMPANMRVAILEAVSHFPEYTFIWKIDKEDAVPKMPNLFTTNWVPQTALLPHPKLRCFVSHGGLNSVLELTRSGKPAILIPLFGDQHRNAKLVERKGSAIVLGKESFTSEGFIDALRRTLEDKKYLQKAERLASLMKKKPFNLKERLLSTVEFSAMHGKIHDLDVYVVDVSESHKILVFSAPLGYSHMQFMGRIADILQEAGHDVTVLHPVWMPKYLPAVSKLTKQDKTKKCKKETVATQRRAPSITLSCFQILFDLPKEVSVGMDPMNLNVWDQNSHSVVRQIDMLGKLTEVQIQSCDLLLGDNRTMEELSKEHFDAGISELLAVCGFGLFSKIGVDHMIGASALGLVDSMAEFFDAPRLPSFVPSYLLPLTDEMNFFERTVNFVSAGIAQFVSLQILEKYQKMWTRHGVLWDEEEFYRRINYLLSNSDEFLEFARPTTAKIVHVGGIALPEKAPLTTEFRELMERKDRDGVVYISFGSVVPTIDMPPYFREAIFHVTRAFPRITFIWKKDSDDVAPAIPNLHTFAWLPQQSLLDHHNLLCFVSHAGLNSVLEVTRSGKPSILVPIFGDQFRNARLVEAKNTTVLIMKEDFNSETFEAALHQVLSDHSFAVRTKRLASLMVSKPFPLKERLLSTVEFSIRHGKIDDLDVYGRNLNVLHCLGFV
ncbi:hypothetical protein ANCCAN_00826 [Ancylostoma caninum]|uniref:glucuronosyltransferase n=1 Tax=Ancylostoma caninum TaxID=29170 RepID=A0A368H8A3_ANCCA|nr:hypothetical protein ANCCAN_00826 [Ancylostoma caninum]